MTVYLAYVAIGIAAGFFSGFLGIGGGIITIPLLLAVFGELDFPTSSIMHIAIGTSLAAMVFSSLSSMLAHHQKKNISWISVFKLLPGIIIGALFGSLTAHLLADNTLELIFGVFLLMLSVYFFVKRDDSIHSHDKTPNMLVLSGFGLLIGSISNILGIGGGTFCVPLFTYFKFPFPRAIGTSIAATFIISLTGALAYLYFGLEAQPDVPQTYGYLYMPAFLIIGMTSWFVAPIGAKAEKLFSQKDLRKIFAILLLVMGVLVFFG